MILIKSYLPKNLIYGVNVKKQSLWEPINESLQKVDNISIDDIKNQVYDLEELLELKLKEKNINKKEIYINLLKNIKDINDINIENIKKLKLKQKLNKLSLQKNFFNPENRYIYSWEQRYDNTYYENKNMIDKGLKNFSKIKIINKFEKKKNNDLKDNYLIFYKKFIFEKNLEKWENNTKFRLEDPLEWYNLFNSGVLKLKKLLESFKRDKKYNHNRIVFWEYPTLDEWNKITYVYIFPKLFFNFFFVIKFIIGSIKLWNIGYWINKWKQYAMYGMRTKINYKDLKTQLEKEWTLEWFKNETDYGSGLYFKNMMKIAKKYDDIKKFAFNNEIFEKKQYRKGILANIIDLKVEEDKLIEIKEYLLDFEAIRLDRIENNFENKFIDINKKLILNIDKVDPKKWAEQELRYKYKDIVLKKKLEVEEEEYVLLKQSYTKRAYRDSDDKHKTLQILSWADEQKIKILMEKKKSVLQYEKNLRDYNFKNKIIDSALDIKEARFFESIIEYNKELNKAYLNIDAEEKQDQSDDTIFEKKINTLYGVFERYYPYYRKWTTMGARMNYVLAQIIMIFMGWIDNIKKIRKNEFNLQNIFKIIWIDSLKYIYNMYWEFLIIWSEYKALKNVGLNFKAILKFSLLFTPIIIYSCILYIIFIIFFVKFIFFIKTKKILQNIFLNITKNIKNILNKNIKNIVKNVIIFFKEFLYYIKSIIYILNLLFKDMETGYTIIEQLYYKFYNLCAIIQRNIFFIKGSFILGYNNNNSIKDGLNSVKTYILLKYNVYIEQKKKICWKSILINKKKNLKIKLELILIITNISYHIKRFNMKLLNKIYWFIIYPIFKIDWKTFWNIYTKHTIIYTNYKLKLNENLKLLFLLRKMKKWDLIKFLLKNLLKLLILPYTFLVRYQQHKYVQNYKKGIQGFRENPMYLVINRPKKKKNWKLKLHNVLMGHKISRYLEELIYIQTHLIEVFFIYKISEVKWTKKNYYQDFFWKKWYWYVKVYKKKILNWLIEFFRNIEEYYQNFEENIETQNWTLWERCKYAYHMYKMYNHVMTRNIQRKLSRDLFFYKRAKERDKIIRIYFIKGIINWITYITINKVIFVKIKDIKNKKIKYKKFTYYINNIKATIHVSHYIEEVPPQFWALVIIYNKYYKYLLKYIYSDPFYPKKWEENKSLEYQRDYKWRLASPEHMYDIPFFDRRFIAADINSFHYTEFLASLANEPYDPLIRWMLFLLEFGMTAESIIEEGNKIYIDKIDEKITHNVEQEVWGDISLTHLLTYSEYLDEYKYEIKEFNRLIKGWDFLKIAENTLERDKIKYYYDKYKFVKDRIMYQNADAVEDMMEDRKLKKSKMLHKALLHYKLKTPKELEEEKEQENLKEYFYVKKKEFFEEQLIEKYWDWQAQYDSKIPEETYYNSNDLWSATFDAHSAEEYFLSRGQLVNYSYLLDHIVLDSYDETMKEIYSFLMFEVWKGLRKILKKDNIISSINYKHIIVDDKTTSRLNYTEHLKLHIDKKFDNVLKKEIINSKYLYIFNKLSWDCLRTNPLYGFIENNFWLFYHEVGDVFTYEDKIQFNVDAIRYQRVDRYHGQETLSRLINILSERRVKLKNIKKSKLFVEDKELNMAFINNVKWTLEQWVIYENIDIENKLLNKNAVIFNEKYNFWNLKRVPIRIKMPVVLNVDKEYVYKYYKDKSNYMDFFWHRGFLMTRTITPILKQSLQWEQCKRSLEKHFNRDIRDLMIWLLTANVFNVEVMKIKRDYEFVLKNFIQNYGVFHKLYFLGLAHYSWDLIRYYEIWWGEDEFPYDQYFQLKQIEFLNHDPGVKRLMVKIHDVFVDKYKPISYIFFFKYQFFPNYLYHFYRFLSISSFIWTLKILFYNPGEYLTNYYMLYAPILLTGLFWCLKKSLEDLRDISKGSEIYLYRYRTSKVLSPTEWEQRKLELEKHKKGWIEHFYDKDKIDEVFGPESEAMPIERDPDWWRYHTHLDKNSKIYSYKHIKFFIFIFAAFVWVDYWKAYKFKYRNSWWLWEYYRHDPDLHKQLTALGKYSPRDFKEREWLQDSWTRVESGGNIYTRWYENYYRSLKKLPLQDLDYGYDWQVERNAVISLIWEGYRLNFKTALADAYWVYFGRTLTARIDHQIEQYKSFSDVDMFLLFVKKVGRRRLKWQKKFLKKTDRKDDDLFLFSKIIKGDFRRLNEDYMSVHKFDRWNSTKRDIKFEALRLKEELRKWYLGDRYIHRRNPYRKWYEFSHWVEDWYNYNILDKENSFELFLIKSNIQTSRMLQKDLKRYITQYDSNIENFFKYAKQLLIREKEIYASHSLSFKSGEALDIRTLLSITEKEKHYHNFCYHFIKYKLDRIIIMKKVHPEYFLTKYKAYKNLISTEKQMSDLILAEHKYLVDVLRRRGQYIKNININIEKSEIIEYKCNLLINFWNDQKDFWILIKDFSQKIDILEFLTILINLLMKIWG
jgi:hypothetical protein